MNRFKLYTKTGDDGTTGLLSGKRVSKHHVRIKAYGTVDELNSFIGLLKDSINDELISKDLLLIQNNLFVLFLCLNYIKFLLHAYFLHRYKNLTIPHLSI